MWAGWSASEDSSHVVTCWSMVLNQQWWRRLEGYSYRRWCHSGISTLLTQFTFPVLRDSHERMLTNSYSASRIPQTLPLCATHLRNWALSFSDLYKVFLISYVMLLGKRSTGWPFRYIDRYLCIYCTFQNIKFDCKSPFVHNSHSYMSNNVKC